MVRDITEGENSRREFSGGSEGHYVTANAHPDADATHIEGEINRGFVDCKGISDKKSSKETLSSLRCNLLSSFPTEPEKANEDFKSDIDLQMRQVTASCSHLTSTTCDLGGSFIASVPATPTARLKRELGLWNGVGIIMGIIIGSGIFVSPSEVLRNTGSIGMAIIIWVFTGIMCIFGALCYAELGTMIPESGGPFTYIYEAFGPIPGFLAFWIEGAMSNPGAKAVAAITFATYLLQPIFPSCMAPPYNAVRLVGAAMMCLVGFINCQGMKFGKRTQDTFALLKFLSLIIITVAGFQHIFRGHFENLLDPMAGTSQSPTSVALAFYSTLYAYVGWNSLNILIEELKDPYRNLPRAIAISITTTIIIYTLTNVAYFAVLTPEEILSSSAVAVTFGGRLFGALALIISFLVACSTFGNTNGNVILQSRLIFVAARKGQMPRFLKLVHAERSTPFTAVLLSIFLPLVMLLVPDVPSLMTYTSFTKNLTDLVCALSLLWLRYKEPTRNRPIKVWLGIPIVYLALTLFVAVLPVVHRPVEIGVAVAVIFAGCVVYYLAIYRKCECIDNALDKITMFCMKLFHCVEEETANKLN